jgi:hypothetical protein
MAFPLTSFQYSITPAFSLPFVICNPLDPDVFSAKSIQGSGFLHNSKIKI